MVLFFTNQNSLSVQIKKFFLVTSCCENNTVACLRGRQTKLAIDLHMTMREGGYSTTASNYRNIFSGCKGAGDADSVRRRFKFFLLFCYCFFFFKTSF